MFLADVCELCLASSNFSLPFNCPRPLPDLFWLDKHLSTSPQDIASTLPNTNLDMALYKHNFFSFDLGSRIPQM